MRRHEIGGFGVDSIFGSYFFVLSIRLGTEDVLSGLPFLPDVQPISVGPANLEL